MSSFNQRQPQKPPPWLLCGTWNELLNYRHNCSYPIKRQPVSQNTRAYLETTMEEGSKVGMPRGYPRSYDSRSCNVTSVVAYSDMTEESCTLAVDEDIQNIISRYIQGTESRKGSTKCTGWYPKMNNENDDESEVSQMSERRKVCHCSSEESVEPCSKCCSVIQSSRRNNLKEEQNEETSTQSFKAVVEEESFHEKYAKSGVQKESQSSSKAPPFRRMKHSHRVDSKLRDQLLIEIQYGRDRLRSTPKQQKSERPLTPRERLLQDIRIGKELRSIAHRHCKC
ncbi:hypothetical protein GpartN1_g3480.t1 [Galdieria partita]|uniref:Uncharacterized protein n=1 Tax=Galdieria partita TaxID=83374 RepID=A0A9C7PWW3_9RHOD|nr:hypothetical protein GpartN1_g3480.t1 [Galdieria partita]